MPDSEDEPVAGSALIHSSRPSDSGRESCINHLTQGETSETSALLLSYPGGPTPQDWKQAWSQYAGGQPSQLQVIRVGDFVRSAAATATSSTRRAPDAVPVETVTDPDDLTAVGIQVHELLENWRAAASGGEPGRVVVCVDSLTSLLDHVGLQPAFRFLHVLVGRLAAVDAVVHFHIDPAAHDDETIATLRPLFDAVVADSSAGSSAGQRPN